MDKDEKWKVPIPSREGPGESVGLMHRLKKIHKTSFI